MNDIGIPTSRRLRLLQAMLERMGATHTIEDIIDLIDSQLLQSFVVNDTWAVTHVVDFPRKRMLEIILVAGDLKDLAEIQSIVEAFARAQGCDLIRAMAQREGWMKEASKYGWQEAFITYQKIL